MLTKVEIRTIDGALLALPIFDPSTGYVVTDIEGLDPVDAQLTSSALAGMDGEVLQASRFNARDIVFRIDLKEEYTSLSTGGLRANLYKFFMPKTRIAMRFFVEGMPTTEIVGHVEKLESPRFVQEPYAYISVRCFDPDFVGIDPVNRSGITVDNNNTIDVDYVGTVPTGFNFTINVNRSILTLNIYNLTPTGEQQDMELRGGFSSGDKVQIDSNPGNLDISLTRGATTTPVLFRLSNKATWVRFEPGLNKFRVRTPAGAPMPWGFYYNPRYGGLV